MHVVAIALHCSALEGILSGAHKHITAFLNGRKHFCPLHYPQQSNLSLNPCVLLPEVLPLSMLKWKWNFVNVEHVLPISYIRRTADFGNISTLHMVVARQCKNNPVAKPTLFAYGQQPLF